MNRGNTFGELLEDARRQSGAEKLEGHDIMGLERFAPDTRHMIVFDVSPHESTIGWVGENVCARFLLTKGTGEHWRTRRMATSKSSTMPVCQVVAYGMIMKTEHDREGW